LQAWQLHRGQGSLQQIRFVLTAVFVHDLDLSMFCGQKSIVDKMRPRTRASIAMQDQVVGAADAGLVARGTMAPHHHAAGLERELLKHLLIHVSTAGDQGGCDELQADVRFGQFSLIHEA
jgi:hypothetical protein